MAGSKILDAPSKTFFNKVETDFICAWGSFCFCIQKVIKYKKILFTLLPIFLALDHSAVLSHLHLGDDVMYFLWCVWGSLEVMHVERSEQCLAQTEDLAASR